MTSFKKQVKITVCALVILTILTSIVFAIHINADIREKEEVSNHIPPIIIAPVEISKEYPIPQIEEIEDDESDFFEIKIIEYIDKYTLITIDEIVEIEEIEEQYASPVKSEPTIFTTYVYHGTRKPLPASENLQRIVYKYAEKYDLPYTIVLALLGVETTWNEDPEHTETHGKATYVGIGCINKAYHAENMKNRGINIYTLDGNVEAVCWLLKAQYDRFGTIHLALMAYNGGGGYADSKRKAGITENGYSHNVIAYAESFR